MMQTHYQKVTYKARYGDTSHFPISCTIRTSTVVSLLQAVMALSFDVEGLNTEVRGG